MINMDEINAEIAALEAGKQPTPLANGFRFYTMYAII